MRENSIIFTLSPCISLSAMPREDFEIQTRLVEELALHGTSWRSTLTNVQSWQSARHSAQQTTALLTLVCK